MEETVEEQGNTRFHRWLLLVVVLCFAVFSLRKVFLVGAGDGQQSVVVYCALDREFAEPILADFTRQTGIRVEPKFDVESTKTVGLVQAILAESDRPRCDVFWNNEILHTLRLQQMGLLAGYQPSIATRYPAAFRDPHGRWHGFAARARVLLIRRDAFGDGPRPTSIHDLANEKWRGRAGIAKPLFGTTATHAACLFATWGDEKAEEFFRQLKANDIQIMAGNKQVAQAVSSGQLDFGLTDTDDAIVEIEAGHPVEIVYPDQQPDGLGTLFIPNTVCTFKGSPHPDPAHKLIAYLLSPAVEEALANGASAQIPLNPDVTIETRVATPKTMRPMQVDFAAAAAKWDTAAKFLDAEFANY